MRRARGKYDIIMRLRYRRGEPVHVQGKQIVKYEGKLDGYK